MLADGGEKWFSDDVYAWEELRGSEELRKRVEHLPEAKAEHKLTSNGWIRHDGQYGRKQGNFAISGRLVGHRGGGGFGVLHRVARRLVRARLSARVIAGVKCRGEGSSGGVGIKQATKLDDQLQWVKPVDHRHVE